MKKMLFLAVVLMTTIMDAANRFSVDQAITADARSTNDIDLGAADQSGDGAGRKVFVTITEAFNTLTSLSISLSGSATANDATPTAVLTRDEIPLADLTVGARFEIPIPANFGYRFASLEYDVVGTNPTTGKITSGIVLAVDTNS